MPMLQEPFPIISVEQVSALRSASRIRILQTLLRRQATPTEIALVNRLRRQTVARHMRALEQADLVERRPSRPWAYYRLSPLGRQVMEGVLPVFRLALRPAAQPAGPTTPAAEGPATPLDLA